MYDRESNRMVLTYDEVDQLFEIMEKIPDILGNYLPTHSDLIEMEKDLQRYFPMMIYILARDYDQSTMTDEENKSLRELNRLVQDCIQYCTEIKIKKS